MNDPSWRCNPPTSPDTRSATSSQESAGGVTPSDSPDGLQTDLFGRVVAPVSPSRPQAPKLAAPIPAIFGRRGISSSASAALQSSLVSRLKQRLDTDGSTLFAMTWSEKATPSGRSVCLLRASGHRTSGSGCGSWPTPNAGPQNDGDTTWEARREALKAEHTNDNGFGMTLGQASSLSSWATPTTRDHKDTGDLSQSMTRRDSKERNDTVPRQAPGLISSGSPAETASPGQLNPAFSRWLQGYPVSWCQAAIRVSRTLTLQRKRGSCG